MRRLIAFLALASLPSCSGDDHDRPVIPTSGLHEACPDSGCALGQECTPIERPGEISPTCEIACQDDLDCPERLYCNVPPLIPDTVPYICE